MILSSEDIYQITMLCQVLEECNNQLEIWKWRNHKKHLALFHFTSNVVKLVLDWYDDKKVAFKCFINLSGQSEK